MLKIILFEILNHTIQNKHKTSPNSRGFFSYLYNKTYVTVNLEEVKIS